MLTHCFLVVAIWFLVTSLINVPVTLGGKKYVLNRPEQPRMLSLGYKIHPFHFPWSCVITYLHENNVGWRHEPSLQYPVGMCSILTKKYILASANNINEWVSDALDKDPDEKIRIFFWQRISDLVVWANLRRVRPTAAHSLSQERRIKNMWVPLKASAYTESPQRRTTENQVFYKNPKEDFNWSTVEQDVAGIAASIVMMEIKESREGDYAYWEFNEWVLPIPIFPHLSQHDLVARDKLQQRFVARIFKDWKHDLEFEPRYYGPCSIGSFGIDGVIDQRKETRFVMLQVVFIPFNDCLEIFCQLNIQYCGRYPIQDYHFCFKSLTYPDVCRFDEGAALYCHWANRSVIGVLAKAFSCGKLGVPGIYTSVGAVVDMYRAILNKDGYYTSLPNRKKGEEIYQDRYSWTIQDAPPTPTPDDALPVPWSKANN